MTTKTRLLSVLDVVAGTMAIAGSGDVGLHLVDSHRCVELRQALLVVSSVYGGSVDVSVGTFVVAIDGDITITLTSYSRVMDRQSVADKHRAMAWSRRRGVRERVRFGYTRPLEGGVHTLRHSRSCRLSHHGSTTVWSSTMVQYHTYTTPWCSTTMVVPSPIGTAFTT